MLANSDLELAAFVLHEATLLEEVPAARMAVPHCGLDNTLTVLWSMRNDSTINPVVADILRTCALHSIQFLLNLS